MTYPGRVKNGVIVLEGNEKLPEGAQVEVRLVPADGGEGPNWAEALKDFIGAAEGLPPDMARNHDHYIHKAPKK